MAKKEAKEKAGVTAPAKPSKVEGTQKYVVINPFRDKESKDGKVIDVDTDVSHFNKDRLTDLVNRGLVTKS